MAKKALNKRRQRKSNKEHFSSDAEYKEFARKRNEATRKCRQKMAHERRFYQQAFLRAQAELDLLRQGGAQELYWRDRAEELQGQMKGEFRAFRHYRVAGQLVDYSLLTEIWLSTRFPLAQA